MRTSVCASTGRLPVCPYHGPGSAKPRVSGKKRSVEDRLSLARKLLEDYESQHTPWGNQRRCPTGLAALDDALDGGLPLGCVCEMITAGEGTGAMDLALRLVRAITGDTRTIFLIDPQGDVYPPAISRRRIALPQLVLVRRVRRVEAAWAMEQALRCRAVGAVVGLFGVRDVRATRRLQTAAEAGGRIGLLVHDDTCEASARFAAVRMVVGRDEGKATERRSHEATKSSRRVQVQLLKGRLWTSGESFLVELGDAAGDVSVHALPGDGSNRVRHPATG